MCFENLHDFMKNGRLGEPRSFLGLNTVALMSVCDLRLLIRGSTDAWRSFAAFLAKTVLPRSVASFKIRAFSGSLSVTAIFTSALRFQLMSTDLAAQGLIC